MPFEFFLFLLRGNVEEVAGKTAKGTRTQEDRQPHEHILVFKTPKAVWFFFFFFFHNNFITSWV
jgi:hypothetical protein|uniref:Uncharacterized protein n=1 Tax=Populus trichocarpa TaxID=3694 RepID=A0A3N7FF01_POPTR